MMMGPLKMLLITVLLLSLVPTTASEVVRSISSCDQFLLDGTSPHIPGVLEDGRIMNQNRYKPICQTFTNQRRFLTLYDTRNKIPVFSANKYRGQLDKRRPQNRWKIEPQLEKVKYGKNMLEDKGVVNHHQAANSDYRNNRTFDRGHLFPSSYGFSKKDKMSTFTLTNVVPQASTFNQGSWNRMERCIKCIMDRYCINNNNVIEGFVVTGAQPSANSSLNGKINVPSTLWSAFCCYSSTRKTWLASAHWGANVPDEPTSKYLQTRTLAELHRELRTAAFPGTRCPLHRTVSMFYPMEANCNCPSSKVSPSTTRSASSTSTSSPQTSTSAPRTPAILSDRLTTEAGSVVSTSTISTSGDISNTTLSDSDNL